MGLELENLDDRTRQLMLDELDQDVRANHLYISSRLSPSGIADYERLLREAILTGDDTSLAGSLRAPGVLNSQEPRQKPKGGVTLAKVPVTAPETLAEGEFNRFYARGLCRRAIEDGVRQVQVYRAKEVRQPRAESIEMVGSMIDADALLEDLRTHTGVDTALHLPPGPNSGLSVRLP